MLEQMRLEFAKNGQNVQFLAINKTDAVDYQSKLTDRASFAILQDLPSVEVWYTQLGGNKDDFYMFAADGRLVDYLPVIGPRNTNLSTPDGYALVKGVVSQALEASPTASP